MCDQESDLGPDHLTFEQRRLLWAKYEDVAMHFNDLLMQLRQRALTGLAALLALGSIAVKMTTAGLQLWIILTVAFLFLAIVWATLWWIDSAYYARLLRGAVDALLEIERHSGGRIILSTRIEGAFPQDAQKKVTRHGLYFPILVFLAAGFLLSGWLLLSTLQTLPPSGRPTATDSRGPN